MKKKILYLLVILALATAIPFIIKGKDGNPLMSMDHFSAPKIALPDLTNLEAKARNTLTAAQEEIETVQEKISDALPKQETKIFKWKDDKGQWHFSDQPRTKGQSTEVKIDSKVNTLPTVKAVSEQKSTPTKNDESSDFGLSLTTVPLGQVPQLIEDASSVKDTLNARYQQFEEVSPNKK